jgi:hypothetical protein
LPTPVSVPVMNRPGMGERVSMTGKTDSDTYHYA